MGRFFLFPNKNSLYRDREKKKTCTAIYGKKRERETYLISAAKNIVLFCLYIYTNACVLYIHAATTTIRQGTVFNIHIA